MATKLEKRVTREMAHEHLGVRYLVMLEPGDFLRFRALRSKKVHTVDLASCLDMAVKRTLGITTMQRKGK